MEDIKIFLITVVLIYIITFFIPSVYSLIKHKEENRINKHTKPILFFNIVFLILILFFSVLYYCRFTVVETTFKEKGNYNSANILTPEKNFKENIDYYNERNLNPFKERIEINK